MIALSPLRPMPYHFSRIVQARCSKCNAYAYYGTASGSRWCIRHWRQHALVEMVQRWYLSDMWMEWIQGRVSVQEREMRKCVQWIRDAGESEIEGVCRLFGLEVA